MVTERDSLVIVSDDHKYCITQLEFVPEQHAIDKEQMEELVSCKR